MPPWSSFAFPGVVQHVVQEDAVPRMTAQTPIVTSFLTCLSFSKAPISWHHIPHVSLEQFLA